MKAMTQSVMAAALLLALPFAGAEACTLSAWNGNTSAAAGVVASGPASTPGFSRYAGGCGAQTGSNQFVTDNTPNAEATYRAAGYVRLSGTGKFFSATTGDGATGTEVFGLSYSGGNIVVSGATGTAPIAATTGRWYFFEAAKQSDGSFSLSVRGAGSATPSTTSGSGVSGAVGSASFGMIGAGTGTYNLDGFVSTRSATTPIVQLCRGDSNNSGGVTAADRSAITAELGGTIFAQGQPDCNEDGNVTAGDRSCVTGLLSQAAGFGCS